jgi:hypothetical protein
MANKMTKKTTIEQLNILDQIEARLDKQDNLNKEIIESLLKMMEVTEQNKDLSKRLDEMQSKATAPEKIGCRVGKSMTNDDFIKSKMTTKHVKWCCCESCVEKLYDLFM